MNYSTPSNWDLKYLLLAQHVGSWSKDPSTKVGSVIVDSRQRVISVGYNGFPQGIEDTEERLNNRELKYRSIIHGEINAIIFAQRSLAGMTVYTYPFMPCSNCASIIIQSGITRVVAPFDNNPRWIESFQISTKDFVTAGVQLDLIDPVLLPSLELRNN